jgi:signal peptidase II
MIHTPTSFSPPRESLGASAGVRSDLRDWIIAAAIAAVVFIVDQLSKRIAFSSEWMSNATVVPSLFGFLHHENHGIVANIPIPVPIIIVITLLILGLIVYAIYTAIMKQRLLRMIALTLIFGGAIGNLYDRLTLGFVRDWILLFDRSVINVADISIFVGILLILITVPNRQDA